VPVLHATVASNEPDAQLIARLCDVAPNGSSLLLSRGVLRLDQDEVALELDFVAHELAPGHRLRLAIAPSYWPLIWPSPHATTLSVHTERSRLVLPICEPVDLADDLGSPEGAPPLDYEVVDGRLKLPDGLESWAQNRDEHSLESDPLSARVDCHRLYGLERDDWQTHVEIDAHMTCDADRFHVETRLQAYEGDTRVHERAWNSSTPRNLR
jgi:hypothetical protein